MGGNFIMIYLKRGNKLLERSDLYIIKSGEEEISKEEFDAALELKNNPPKTYAQELTELNSEKDIKMDDFNKKILSIIALDGATENPAKSAIRTNVLGKINSDYAAAKAALKIKYGV